MRRAPVLHMHHLDAADIRRETGEGLGLRRIDLADHLNHGHTALTDMVDYVPPRLPRGEQHPGHRRRNPGRDLRQARRIQHAGPGRHRSDKTEGVRPRSHGHGRLVQRGDAADLDPDPHRARAAICRRDR